MAESLIMSEMKVGGQTIKNRVCLAPLTRGRSGPTRIPNDLMVEYYAQRASGGIVITEATAVSAQGYGWREAPAMYTKEMAAGWKKIVDAVHAKDGVIYMQLWHMGRQSHSSYHETKEIVSASAIAVGAGEVTCVDGAKAAYEVPRPLKLEEMAGVVADYAKAAQLCKDVGFDGVEVHAANGYLIDQFLQSCSNQREDKYGGSMENRARFLMEIIDAVEKVYPANRIAVRLAPNGAFGGMGSEDNYEMFPYVASRLNPRGLAYLHIMDGLGFGFHAKCKQVKCADIRKVFDGPIMGNVGLTQDTAEGMIRSGAADLAAFGRLYISNPDLPERFKNGWPLADPADHTTWWDVSLGAKGYTDWPCYTPKAEDEKKQQK